MTRLRLLLVGGPLLLLALAAGVAIGTKLPRQGTADTTTAVKQAESVSFVIPEGWDDSERGTIIFDHLSYPGSCDVLGPDWTPRGTGEYAFTGFPGDEDFPEEFRAKVVSFSTSALLDRSDTSCGALPERWQKGVEELRSISDNQFITPSKIEFLPFLAGHVNKVNHIRYVANAKQQVRGVAFLLRLQEQEWTLAPVYVVNLYSKQYDQIIEAVFRLRLSEEVKKMNGDGSSLLQRTDYIEAEYDRYVEVLMKDFPNNLSDEFTPLRQMDAWISSIQVKGMTKNDQSF